MGQATRTTKLPLDLSERDKGGTNTRKRAFLHATARVLNEARAFYIEFFLAHAEKLKEKVSYYSEHDLQMRERPISAKELLTWAEACTVATKAHPHPWPGWDFSERFPEMPFAYRRSVIKDAIGKVRSYLSHLANWQKTGKKKGKPGLPGARNHPTLYQGLITLDLAQFSTKECYVRLTVYTGEQWEWHNYPVRASRYFQQRITQAHWEKHSPKLVLHQHEASLHFAQIKQITAHKVVER
jgi:putative transposase